MKNIFLILTSLLLIMMLGIVPLQAQEEDEEVVVKNDTTEIIVGNRKIIITTDSSGTDVSMSKVERPRSNSREKDFERQRDNDRDEQVIEDDRDNYYKNDNDHDHDGDDDDDERDRVDVGLFGMDLGVSNFYGENGIGADEAGLPSQMALKPLKSTHVALHFLPTKIDLTKAGEVSLKTALTFDMNNYKFENPDFLMVSDTTSLTLIANPDAARVKKAKFRTSYLQIPLLLSIDTKPDSDNSLVISVGGYAGIPLRGKTKVVYNDREKQSVKNRYNQADYRYGLTARFDFKWIDVYVNYDLSAVFAEGQGPQAQTVSAGINLINF